MTEDKSFMFDAKKQPKMKATVWDMLAIKYQLPPRTCPGPNPLTTLPML
jgi:hypothetical protein